MKAITRGGLNPLVSYFMEEWRTSELTNFARGETAGITQTRTRCGAVVLHVF